MLAIDCWKELRSLSSLLNLITYLNGFRKMLGIFIVVTGVRNVIAALQLQIRNAMLKQVNALVCQAPLDCTVNIARMAIGATVHRVVKNATVKRIFRWELYVTFKPDNVIVKKALVDRVVILVLTLI